MDSGGFRIPKFLFSFCVFFLPLLDDQGWYYNDAIVHFSENPNGTIILSANKFENSTQTILAEAKWTKNKKFLEKTNAHF